MFAFDLHHVGVYLLTFASILSLLFIVAKALTKEFEDISVRCIRAFKRIRKELREPSLEVPAQPPQLVERTRSKRGLD